MIKVLSFLLISTYVLSAYAQYNLTTPSRILRSSELKRTDGYIMEEVQGCEVHMTKHPTGHIQLFWQRGPVSVFIHAVADEAVYQDWNFEDTHIHVEMTNENVTSTWKFSPTMEAKVVIDESNDADKTPEKPKITWKDANEQDETKIKTYFKYMEQWCEYNKAFIAFESCAIAYEPEETQTDETQSNGMPNDETPANGTPTNGTPTDATPTNG